MTLSLIRLAGTHEAMGAQHGELVADDAARLFAFYRTLPERALAGDQGPLVRAVVLAAARTWQARLLRERSPELAARTHAFVDAAFARQPHAGSREDAVRAFAVMDALQNCVTLVARARLGPFHHPFAARAALAAVPACSTLIAWGRSTVDGELVFARNFDFPGVGVWDVAPAFVMCAPTDGQRYGFFTTRGADAPVVTVVNEAGLVIAPHTRWHRDVVFGGAMIVDLVHDIARRAESLADARAIVRERAVSSTWGIAIGSARERQARVFELAGERFDEIEPRRGATTLVCTNHYHAALRDRELAGSRAWTIHSDRRERRLNTLVQEHGAPLDDVALARMLGDRRDPESPEVVRHLGAILSQPVNVHAAVVSPARQRALVGIDRAPCCEGRWAELTWDWSGPTGETRLGAERIEQAGFVARVRGDIAAPHDAATLCIREAAHATENERDITTARGAIERAVGHAPDDPSLRLAAAWLALAGGSPARAIEHVHAGLAREVDPYRRGQFLAWGVRAARREDPGLARQWEGALASADPDLRRLARGRGRPHVNLMLADAY